MMEHELYFGDNARQEDTGAVRNLLPRGSVLENDTVDYELDDHSGRG